MKTVVIYKSPYGTTKQYAQWISQALQADLFEQSKIKSNDLCKYDVIIYGGGLYAGGISGVSLITKNFDQIKDKKIVVFTVGIADPKNKENVEHIRQSAQKIFGDEMQDKITLFHLRGGIDYSQLGFVHQSMMGMMKKMLSKKAEEDMTDEDKQMLETYGKKVEFTNQNTIGPLVEFVSQLSK